MKAIYTIPLILIILLTVYLFTPINYEYHAGTNLMLAYVESSKASIQDPVIELLEELEIKEVRDRKLETNTDGLIAGSYADDPLLLHFFVKHLDNKKMNMTSDYGPRPKGGRYKFHYGIDIQGNSSGSQKVDALSPGPTKVISAELGGANSGNVLVLEDLRSGLVYRFMHLHKIYVKVGDTLSPGEAVARMGDTGTDGKWHVHFEIDMTAKTDPAVKEKIKANSKWKKHEETKIYETANPQNDVFKYDMTSKPPAGIGVALKTKSNHYNWVNVASDKPKEDVESEASQTVNEIIEKVTDQ